MSFFHSDIVFATVFAQFSRFLSYITRNSLWQKIFLCKINFLVENFQFMYYNDLVQCECRAHARYSDSRKNFYPRLLHI